MAGILLSGGMVYDGHAVTLAGLRHILASMRWQDLERFAEALEDARKEGVTAKSSRPLTAQAISDWLDMDEY